MNNKLQIDQFKAYDLDDRLGRTSISNEISNIFANLGITEEQIRKARKASKVKALFVECINDVYHEASSLILDKTNAVYLLHEKDTGSFKVERPGDKMVDRLIIYTCDSMVHADLDARQEEIKRAFMKRNQKIDSFELLSSKYDMRKKFPFKNSSPNIDTSNKSYKIQKMNAEQVKTAKEEINKIKNEDLQQCLYKIVKLFS